MWAANVIATWSYNIPGAEEAKKDALLRAEMAAMEKIVQIAEPITTEIADLSVQITELEERKKFLSTLYRELEEKYKEHSSAYDKLNEQSLPGKE